MPSDILVDGYNVIKNNPMFKLVEAKNRAEARNVLVKQLKNRFRDTIYRVIVVFDGSGSREQTIYEDHICIIYSRHGETADSVIARLAAEARKKGNPILTYSDDGEVKQSVKDQGGKAKTTHQLTTALNAAPYDVATRAQHRIEMKRMYGMDPRYKYEEDEKDPYQKPSNSKKKKKGKSSHRYKSLK
ncbi:MAG TPA: NYN domain-containing protein [Dictyobacter sp.]|nr:NYN domain-containing protein [Dictyobacter sp.]